MSQWRGRLEENPELERAINWLDEYYHLVLGALLLGFILWNRVRPWENFYADGEVLFRGNDPWYHFRSTVYTVRNWPATMPFDPWTYFPHGTSSGQFGTLYDQIMATAALIVGLGSPSETTIGTVMLFTPPVFAVAVGVVAYFIGRRVGGRAGGLVAVGVLALSSGRFLQRSMVGFTDHHVAEALFQALGVLGVMVAISVAQRDKPVYEQFVAREVDPLRETVGYSVLAGLAITLYLWVWPPGVLLLGVLGTYFLLQLTVEFLRGESPEHTAIAGTITMATAGTLVLPAFQTVEITATNFSLLHPLLSYGVAAGCVFMAWLARQWDRRELDNWLYPATVGGILVVGTALVAVLLPDVFGFFVNNVERVIGFTTTVTGGTVGEVQPLNPDLLFPIYGFTIIVAAIGAGIVLIRMATGRVPAQQFLLVVWAAFMTAATLTQGRFEYYLTVPVGALTGYVAGGIFRRIAADVRENDIQTYQVIAVLATLLVVFAPMAAVQPATDIRVMSNPGGDIEGWSDGLTWFQQNTPQEGQYGGADADLEYYGTYPSEDDYDYEAGHYGVMSWWDYGHWITVHGEAIPNANPFQQGATMAANFLLAPNETQANDVLDQIDEDDARTRYVAVDWQMVTVRSKFTAPSRFYNASDDVGPGTYTRQVYYDAGGGRFQSYFVNRQPYYNSTMVRLYHYHGSAQQPQPVVIDWEVRNVQGRQVRVMNSTIPFDSMRAAQNYVENDSTATIGGVGGLPSERVPAMEHYRMVGASERSATTSGSFNRALLITAQGLGSRLLSAPNPAACPSDVSVTRGDGNATCLPPQVRNTLLPTEPQWVKFFERVPGATVEGTGPSNATVTARVEMRNPAANETFVYTQRTRTDEDGEFTMTVPYSTTGYDEWGTDEGYTNTSVRANSSYQFSAGPVQDEGNLTVWSGSADVTEGQVIGENDSAVTVQLESNEIQLQPQDNESDEAGGADDGNDGGDQTDEGTETDGDTTDSDGTTETDSGTETASPTPTDTVTETDTAAETDTATETDTAN